MKESQSVVVAFKNPFTNYPVLDFAMSLYSWFNVKVDDSTPTVKSGAFVTLLLDLGLADKVDGKLVMRKEHENAQFKLTMMRNNAKTTCNFKMDEAGTNHIDLKYSEVKEVFDKHVSVQYIDMGSSW